MLIVKFNFMPIINCLVCGKEKYFKLSRIKMGQGKFCSNQCRSKASVGRKLSPETCLKMSKSRKGENHPMFGKKHTAKSLAKMSKSHSGHTCTAEHKNKISKALMGKIPKNLKWLHIFNKGENHGMWKGDKVKNGAIHDWVQRWKGKPKQCVDCGATAEEKRLGWSNIDHKHRRNLDDYFGRCDMCHRTYDKKHNNYIFVGAFKKGHIVSKETKQKMSLALIGNKRTLGYRHSEETKRKISEARKKIFSRG